MSHSLLERTNTHTHAHTQLCYQGTLTLRLCVSNFIFLHTHTLSEMLLLQILWSFSGSGQLVINAHMHTIKCTFIVIVITIYFSSVVWLPISVNLANTNKIWIHPSIHPKKTKQRINQLSVKARFCLCVHEPIHLYVFEDLSSNKTAVPGGTTDGGPGIA